MLLGKVKTLFLDARKGWIGKEIETAFESLPERERETKREKARRETKREKSRREDEEKVSEK